MTLVYELFVCFLLWSGLFFIFVGVVGLIRLPDIYNRMHATSKCDTLGTGLILLAMMTQVGGYTEIIKLVMIAAFIWSINPVVTHILGSTSYIRGQESVPQTFFRDCYHDPYPGRESQRRDVNA